MPAPSAREVRRGILYMLAAVFVFSVANALVKWYVAAYPVGEVVFFRCAFAAIPALALMAAGGGWRVVRTAHRSQHLGRGVLVFLAQCSAFSALALLPLADAIALGYSAPLFVTLLSIPLLGEKVGWPRWLAVLAGFVGVLIILRPGPGMLEAGALFALANAALLAVTTIAVRRMTVTESTATIVFYQVAATTPLSLLLLPFGWVTPGWADLAGLAAIGVASGIGQYLWAQTFRFTPAAVAAPFNYLSLFWAALFGFLVWGEVPTLAMLGGAAIVAASGLFIAYRETRRGART